MTALLSLSAPGRLRGRTWRNPRAQRLSGQPRPLSLSARGAHRRRSALHAIACSHLLKTPRYLLGHT